MTFISFEGIDGAGKTTHIDALARRFTAQGRTVTRSREPGGTELAEKLRNLILHEPMDTMTEVLLMFAARRDHVQRVIVPALARGDVVLCDRFADASFAYQGAGRGLDWAILLDLERWVLEGLQPDLTIWFDLPADIAAQRLRGTRVPDRFEAQPQSFFEAVSSGYARRMTENPQRFARINANQTPQQVWNDVESAVKQREHA